MIVQGMNGYCCYGNYCCHSDRSEMLSITQSEDDNHSGGQEETRGK